MSYSTWPAPLSLEEDEVFACNMKRGGVCHLICYLRYWEGQACHVSLAHTIDIDFTVTLLLSVNNCCSNQCLMCWIFFGKSEFIEDSVSWGLSASTGYWDCYDLWYPPGGRKHHLRLAAASSYSWHLLLRMWNYLFLYLILSILLYLFHNTVNRHMHIYNS